MTFFESIKTVFRKYATFEGRATRPEFWWFALFSFLVSASLIALLPGPHPITWICPVLLAMPPMALAYRLILGRAVPRLCLWAVAILLAAFGFLLVVFVVTTFIGH